MLYYIGVYSICFDNIIKKSWFIEIKFTIIALRSNFYLIKILKHINLLNF